MACALRRYGVTDSGPDQYAPINGVRFKADICLNVRLYR
jgi:hypothetical protein